MPTVEDQLWRKIIKPHLPAGPNAKLDKKQQQDLRDSLMPREFDSLLSGPDPILALAPMQDVTDLPFWKLMTAYGGADVYYTEYFRVHATSTLDKYILRSITENPTGRPVIAQMIGNDIPALIRIAREL